MEMRAPFSIQYYNAKKAEKKRAKNAQKAQRKKAPDFLGLCALPCLYSLCLI